MVSPGALTAAGGGAILGGVVVALPLGLSSLLGAISLGAIAWAGWVGMALYRGYAPRQRSERIDPFAVQEPWRWHVQTALANRAKVRERVDSTPAGPLRDRLAEIAARVARVADESWQIARRGQTLAEARRTIDTPAIDRKIAELERSSAATPHDERVTNALEARRAQRAGAERLDHIIDDTHSQLKLLDARMGEVVVRVIELSAQIDSDAPLATLSGDVDDLVIEMEALRQALEEAGIGSPGGSWAGDQE